MKLGIIIMKAQVNLFLSKKYVLQVKKRNFNLLLYLHFGHL